LLSIQQALPPQAVPSCEAFERYICALEAASLRKLLGRVRVCCDSTMAGGGTEEPTEALVIAAPRSGPSRSALTSCSQAHASRHRAIRLIASARAPFPGARRPPAGSRRVRGRARPAATPREVTGGRPPPPGSEIQVPSPWAPTLRRDTVRRARLSPAAAAAAAAQTPESPRRRRRAGSAGPDGAQRRGARDVASGIGAPLLMAPLNII
jgi:hypothetical protein